MAIIELLTSLLFVLSTTRSKGEVEANCFHNDRDLHPDILRSHRIQMDPNLMSEVYSVVDQRLQRDIGDDDLDKNMKMVMRLLRNEIDLKSARGKRFCLGLGTRPLISEDFDKNVTINALLRLNDLKKVKKSGFGCSPTNTQHLAENNAIAEDPIGRRLRNEPNLLPRIDNLIFNIAQQRAEHCVPKYKVLLTNIHNLESFQVIKDLWDPIFKHRLVKADFNCSGQIDSVFENSPQQALDFFDNEQYATAQDEMDIILKHLSRESTRSSFKFPYDGSDPNIRKFEKFAQTPCANYVNTTSHLFESLDFDMKFKPYLTTGALIMVDKDHIVHKLKAYYTMCRKLGGEKERFIHLLNRYLIDSLPYKLED